MKNENHENTKDAIQENMAESMKWVQKTTAAWAQTYAQQVEMAGSLFNNSLQTALGINKSALSGSNLLSEKTAEVFQKNMESLSNLNRTHVERLHEFSKESAGSVFSKEKRDNLLNIYNKQAEELKAFNASCMESINRQFSSAKNALSPVLDKIKKNLDTNLDSAKESMKAVSDFQNQATRESAEAGKELLSELNTRMNQVIANNYTIWSEIMNTGKANPSETDHKETTAKTNTAETKQETKTSMPMTDTTRKVQHSK